MLRWVFLKLDDDPYMEDLWARAASHVWFGCQSALNKEKRKIYILFQIENEQNKTNQTNVWLPCNGNKTRNHIQGVDTKDEGN
jgi:hypothetical protein